MFSLRWYPISPSPAWEFEAIDVPDEKGAAEGEYELKRNQLPLLMLSLVCPAKEADYRLSLQSQLQSASPLLPTVATFAPKSGTNFRPHFVRDFSAMTTNERHSGF